MLRGLMLAYLANIALKYAVRRARPVLEGLPALSRAYAGVHYPSDVAAGAALGTAIAELPAPRGSAAS